MSDFHILAFETSSSLCGVALVSSVAGRLRLRSAGYDDRQGHTSHILPLAQQLLTQAGLRPADLAAVAFGQGPGGFTGLRVACGVAQGMALALGLRVIPVDSMQAIARQGAGTGLGVHLVLQDARMHEIYAAAYRRDQDRWHTVQAPALLALADVPGWLVRESPHWLAGGDGVMILHGDALAAMPGLQPALERAVACELRAAQDADGRAHAAMIARMAAQAWLQGRSVLPEHAMPVYVRDRVAFTTRERAQGQGGNPAAGDGFSLHAMAPSDLDEVAAIERRVQAYPWTRQNFADGLAAGYTAWVLRRMGGMQGFAMVMDTPDVAHLLVIGVRPDCQRQGAGSRLMQACLGHCRQRGLRSLTLEVRPSNRRAIAFYTAFGFRHVGTRRNYYPAPQGAREDAWIMTRDLEPA